MAPQVDSRGGGAFSAAGSNNRYNNIQIDGAVNNDLFGLGGSGTPGGTPEPLPSRSTPSRNSSWSSPPTTSARADSPAAA